MRRIRIAFPPSSNATPAWMSGQAIGEWREIAGSSISLAPNYNAIFSPLGEAGPARSKLDSWNGLQIDTRNSKVYSVSNGGHNNYWGNEVNVISLEDDEPAWTELLTTSDVSTMWVDSQAQRDAGSPAADYCTDGRPVSRHSYYTQQFIESINRAMLIGVGSAASYGFAGKSIDGFNVALNIFDAQQSFGPVPFSAAPAGHATAKHPTTEEVYCWNQATDVWKWTPGFPGTWTKINTAFPPKQGTSAASVIDPTHNWMYIVGGTSTSTSHSMDLTTGTFTARPLTGSQAAKLTTSFQIGMHRDPNTGLYMCRFSEAGGNVYTIDPATMAAEVYQTTGGDLLPAGNGGSGERTFNKFLYVPRLGGYAYFPGYDANGWFLRTT